MHRVKALHQLAIEREAAKAADPDAQRLAAAEAEHERLRRLHAVLDSSGAPPLVLRQAAWPNALGGYRESAAAVQLARAWAQDPVTASATISGAPGTGKTYLMALMLKDLATRLTVDHHTPRLRWARAITITRWFRQRDRQTDGPTPYHSAAVLFIDDLGCEPSTEWLQCELEDLLNERIEAGLPTVVTTNLADRSVLSARYSAPMVSRLTSAEYRIPITGVPDLRQQGTAR